MRLTPLSFSPLYLRAQVAKEIWVCDKGRVTPWKGDIRAYKVTTFAW